MAGLRSCLQLPAGGLLAPAFFPASLPKPHGPPPPCRPEFGVALAMALSTTLAAGPLWLSLHLLLASVLAVGRWRGARCGLRPADRCVGFAIAAAASLVLVLLTSLTASPVWLALHLLVGLVGSLGRRPAGRRDGMGQRLLGPGLAAALERSHQLVALAELLHLELLERLPSLEHLEDWGQLQLCGERLQALPARIMERRAFFEAGGELRRQAEALDRRLSCERLLLRREVSPILRGERVRLVEQLRRNLQVARLGSDEQASRLLALSTRLERIEGGLLHLQRHLKHQWISPVGAEGAIALLPLREALDQMEELLVEGLSP